MLEERAVDRGAALAHERGAVGARAAHFQVQPLHAMGLHVASTIWADAAPRKRDDDVIAGCEFRHAVADGLHHARAFVAVNRGIGRVVVAVATVQVGLAHAARHDPDQRLVRPRIGQFEPIDREGTEFFAHDGGGDFHGS